MAATNSEEYEKWVTSLQLITNRFGIAAAAAASSVNRRSETPLRGASVPCLSGSSSSTTSFAVPAAPGLPNVASQPNAIASTSGSPEV